MKIPRSILQIIQKFEKNGFECYVVGGSVRDNLLHRKISDFDLCTNALPEQTMVLFDHTIPTGIKHGTITIVIDGQFVEVTTFRKEGEYTDHRHPDQVRFVKDLRSDLARRDLTINAMAYSPKLGYIDPFGGMEDLKKKLIKTVGDPEKRFEEDALRMVRAHRFAAVLGFSIDESTQKAIEKKAGLIQFVAIERLFGEWMKILKADPYEVKKMLPLFRPWLPELTAASYCEQNSPYHDKNVLDHTLEAITYVKPFDEMCALALLLHDLGKPYVLITGHDGRDHFKGHPQVSYEIALRVCKEWKLSNEFKNTVPDLVLYHDEIETPTLAWLYKFCVELQFNKEKMHRLFLVQYGDIMAHSKKGRQRLNILKEMVDFYEKESEKRPVRFSELALDGKEVAKIANVSGPDIGKALKHLLKYAFYHPEKNTKEGLAHYLEKGMKKWNY